MKQMFMFYLPAFEWKNYTRNFSMAVIVDVLQRLQKAKVFRIVNFVPIEEKSETYDSFVTWLYQLKIRKRVSCNKIKFLKWWN